MNSVASQTEGMELRGGGEGGSEACANPKVDVCSGESAASAGAKICAGEGRMKIIAATKLLLPGWQQAMEQFISPL